MSFQAWKKWLLALPWSFRWFAILVLLRPILDVFYFLKEISPAISPLYIVGTLTPILIIFLFLTVHFPEKKRTSLVHSQLIYDG